LNWFVAECWRFVNRYWAGGAAVSVFGLCLVMELRGASAVRALAVHLSSVLFWFAIETVVLWQYTVTMSQRVIMSVDY
jgi:hypothetical protein